MGVDLGELLNRKGIELKDMSGRWIAVDAYNTLYQFLSIIRQQDGTPLMDSSGRVTSHLSGLLYRVTSLAENGAKLAFIFDGQPPVQKSLTLEERCNAREKAQSEWQSAIARGEGGIKYAQASSRLSQEILDDSIRLLCDMGVPVIRAPSEGEAQAAHMTRKGDAHFAASQDYDALLFGAPRVVRNLAITGKRKLPRKNVYIDVSPEVIHLQEDLARLGINQRQLVEIAILCGTDYNPGVPRVGPKTAYKLIRQHGDLESALSSLGEAIEDHEDVRELFLHPKVTDEYVLKQSRPRPDQIVAFLCQERDFSEERVAKAAERLEEAYNAGQSTLDRWI
ncbi:MAG: Flap endonuclease 1 [Methanosaeta sp. PtaB.Bin039]|nr:MAG: Flap endonuclease 1 [Methanosaeta sp. PtaB.Bin039]OPY46461.1 MAG: Flap endonuclease 1 [Methanosaeta sp. PtaU1.Bin028]HOT07939.1 flap endonuclease-1 [Methanotrichaceae archaeon]HQF16847.1 flap endonuclease-1 [Methanotrichaceae archaeon]HQI91413.1 flap endonuclease-1 [Methanotrichaceae archaeon]